jgi:integrase
VAITRAPCRRLSPPPACGGGRDRTKLGNHSFRATGITAYLKNGGTLEKAAAMANHASTRTTQLYDRRRDELSLDEVERIVI